MEWLTVGEPEVQRQRGKWVVRQGGYDPKTGRRRVRQLGTFDTRREAMARCKAVASGRAGTEDETLGEFLTAVWLPSKQGRVERSTLDQYEWAIHRHVVPLIGAVRMRDLSPEVIDAWITDLGVTPAGAKKPRLGATSVRIVRKVLSMALQEAVQRERLPRNPVPLTQPPRPRRRSRKQSWTLDEAKAFLAAVRHHRLYALFQLALVTGLRRGELLGLPWVDVDIDGRQVHVTQQLALEAGRPVLKSLKTETSERIVTFGPATAAALRAHRDLQAAEASFAGTAWHDSGLVFTTQLGGWIDPNNFRRLMDELVEEAGVPRITPKGLRHTAQSVGRVVVGDDKVMQERLGHADIGVTLNTYTHVVTDQHRKAGDALDDIFKTDE